MGDRKHAKIAIPMHLIAHLAFSNVESWIASHMNEIATHKLNVKKTLFQALIPFGNVNIFEHFRSLIFHIFYAITPKTSICKNMQSKNDAV